MTFDKGGDELPSKRPPYPGSASPSNLESGILACLKRGTPWSKKGGYALDEIIEALGSSSDKGTAALSHLTSKDMVVSAVSEINGKRCYYLT